MVAQCTRSVHNGRMETETQPKHRAHINTTDMASRARCTAVTVGTTRQAHLYSACPFHHPLSYAVDAAKHRARAYPYKSAQVL